MFIIFGSPRSGTTLLSSVLDAHDDIVVPDETDFIV
ncbi:sulfotransferase [Paenibacillus rhizovicinus]|uniref:Sulfotransferase n=1 Tax=Paenibacillus rhizovicinus TaxID=2704463 RepID=A0A6C0P4E5_9BACL|nr:sulfotransferase [Paenibacillus rhizovicinus]